MQKTPERDYARDEDPRQSSYSNLYGLTCEDTPLLPSGRNWQQLIGPSLLLSCLTGHAPHAGQKGRVSLSPLLIIAKLYKASSFHLFFQFILFFKAPVLSRRAMDSCIDYLLDCL